MMPTIKLKAEDFDGASSNDIVPDTEVESVWICVDGSSCEALKKIYNETDGFYNL